MIQEIQRKKANTYGAYRELEAYSPYATDGKPKYSYHYTGGRFDRPIKTAYKISIHESKRVNGVVTKRQHVVTTVDYYSLAESWIGDCIVHKRLEAIAASLGATVDSLHYMIFTKVDPLQARIDAEFKETDEYKTRAEHEKILKRYRSKKDAFAKAYGVSSDIYDYCFNVFGEVMNQAYLDEIIEADRKKQQTYSSYYSTGSSNYTSGGYDYSKLFSSSSAAYSAEDKARLKKFYKALSKIYHPDMNLDMDTHAEMVLLNKLKEEWGI